MRQVRRVRHDEGVTASLRDFPTATTVWTQLQRCVAEHPDAPVLFTEQGDVVTFAELRERAERLAAGLQARGIGEGSRVTWQLPTRLETVLLIFALARLGAVQNPVIHLYGQRELGFIVRQTRAELLILPGRWRDIDYAARARELCADLPEPPEVLLTEAGLPDADPGQLPPPPADLPAERSPVRWIFYTSGTSADPKGVCHTDATVIAAGHALVHCHALTPDDIGSIAFPIAHAGGPQYLASMLEARYPALLIEQFSPRESFRLMRERGVSLVGGSTAFYVAVLAAQRAQPDEPLLPRLRALTGGGAPKPPQLYYDVLREVGRPILHGLGMTESPCITMGAVTDTDEQRAYTEGLPVPGMQVRIVGPDGQPVPNGADGEIQMQGACRTVGYVDPHLNATLLTTDGWLRTGDLGRIRDDGHLVITGRQKDVIIRKGENVSARELEELLLTHPHVADVAVIGLPDAERGELVCAVVEPPSGRPALDFDAMIAHLRAAGITVQKMPERLEIVDALPRNAFSKVLKTELRARFSGVSEPAAAQPTPTARSAR
jgi:acyl-CoA synthetase (AMP-forming)/AMP-acid ligase II